MRILLDMDEVLCNFSAGVANLWGVPLFAIEAWWKPGVWDIVPPLSKTLGLEEQMSVETFWEALNDNEEFWKNLDYTPWMHELVELVKSLTNDWHIISSPSWCPSCYSGKVHWLKRVFGRQFNHFALTPHKEIFAGPNVILIDDSDANVKKFIAGGGSGIVFPRLHNSNHRYRGLELQYVNATLKDLMSVRPG